MDKPLALREDRTELIEAESDNVANLPAAIEQLQRALNGMAPDDLSIEFTSERSGDRSKTSFRFRAYRRANE